MRVYISGPISGRDLQERQLTFKEAADKLAKEGHFPVNPMEVMPCNDMRCDPGQLADQPPGIHTWQCYMKHDIAAMMDCEAIAMLPEWLHSKGALIEYDLALKLGYTVIYLNEDGDVDHVG